MADDLRLDDVPEPESPVGQQVLVAPVLCGICGTDVETIAAGDRVSVMPLLSCGRCVACRRGESHQCEIRACVGLRHPWGGMSERVLLDQDQLTRLPDATTFTQGALVEPTAVAMSRSMRASACSPTRRHRRSRSS